MRFSAAYWRQHIFRPSLRYWSERRGHFHKNKTLFTERTKNRLADHGYPGLNGDLWVEREAECISSPHSARITRMLVWIRAHRNHRKGRYQNRYWNHESLESTRMVFLFNTNYQELATNFSWIIFKTTNLSNANRCGWDKNKKIREDSLNSWLKIKGFSEGFIRSRRPWLSAPVVGEVMTTGLLWTSRKSAFAKSVIF